MAIELKVPQVGESITEVQIGRWYKQPGDWVKKDEVVVEIETDKATVDLPAPESGHIAKVLKQQGAEAEVGEVVGFLEPAEQPAGQKSGKSQNAGEKSSPSESSPGQPKTQPERQQNQQAVVMPAAQRLLAENDIDPADVEPSGPGGRLLKEDVQRFIAERESGDGKSAAGKGDGRSAPAAEMVPSSADGDPGRQEEIVPMTPIRRRIAERLVQAQQQAALLTTFNEVDLSKVIELRKTYQESFQKKYGIKLGFMSFFVKAAIEALKQIPAVAAEIRGNDLVYRNYHDIGIAVGGGRGLVVPVIRSAERMSFAEIELTISDFGKRARDNKIRLEELQGGTFTISNGGVYGSMLSTPIVNPPQSGVLGLHAIEDRPVAREGQVVIRPMMYLALSYDHRVVDGREAVTFLRHIKEVIEDPTRMLIEV